ncbi:MAG: TonB-dependent receptor [Chitinophagaceae bacterium]
MKIFALLALSFLSLATLAQMPGGMNRSGNGQQMTGRFYGKIVDANNKGIEAASVILVTDRIDSATKQKKEVIIDGMLTTATGDFSLENVPLFARYRLKVSGIGFKPIEQPVQFQMPNRNDMSSRDQTAMLGAIDKDLGNIKLEIDDKVLAGVTVSAARSGLQLGIDRKVFNVERNITSAGGTAVDVMKNVPSVNVDIDGNVTLRNNAPQIFVDGRPTNLTLEQIPADAIESVEIITNPSAKFDASGGTAGILNIVMKKNKRVGYAGNVRANVDSRGKFGGGGDINLRQNKINLFASGMYMQRKSISEGTTNRTTFTNPNSVLSQFDNSTMNAEFGFLRGGFDYFIDNRNTLTINGTFVKGSPKSFSTSDIYADTLYSQKVSTYTARSTQSDNQFKIWGTQLSYKHNFPKAGHELSGDITYNSGQNNNTNFITNSTYRMPQNTYVNGYNQQQIIGGTNKNLIAQMDYANPLNDHSKIEAGVRASIREINSANQYYTVAPNGTLIPSNANVIYNSKDNVYAGYVTFSNRINKFGYQLGLRAESSDYNGDLPNKGQTFNVNFPISFFPSVFLTEKFDDNNELQLNYSRRINRPNFFQLFPFVDSSDLLNVRVGNPGLTPEFTNSLELSYAHTFQNKDNFIASIYFKNTNDLITQVVSDTVFNGKPSLITQYVNANRSYVTGLELTGKNKVTKWWDLTSNINLFTSKITLDNQPSQDPFVSYFLKLNNSFKLPKNFSLQLSGDYQSKIISSPGGSQGGGGGRGGFGGGGMFGGGMFGGGSLSAAQGYIRPNYGVDAAIRYDFLKNKVASLSLNVNDIFRTRLYDAHSESSLFTQDVTRRRDPQVFRLNFNFRFGKFDPNLFKRKNTKAEGNIDTGSGI